jgi:hypothetical protein
MVSSQKRWKKDYQVAGQAGKSLSLNQRYFFLDGVLYRTIHINRHHDLIACLRMRDREEVVFMWSDVKRNRQKAFMSGQVARLLGLSRMKFLVHVWEGRVTNFEWLIKADGQKQRIFSEDDVLDAWEALSNVHIGRPRKDGRITTRKTLPTKAELLSVIKEEEVLYYWDKETERFMPVWRPKKLG